MDQGMVVKEKGMMMMKRYSKLKTISKQNGGGAKARTKKKRKEKLMGDGMVDYSQPKIKGYLWAMEIKENFIFKLRQGRSNSQGNHQEPFKTEM